MKIPADQWLTALSDPRTDLNVERFGLTQVSSRWHLQHRVIPEHYLTMVVKHNNCCQAGSDLKKTILDTCLGPESLLMIAPHVPHCMRPLDLDHPHTFYHLRFTLTRHGEPLMFAEDVLSLPHAGSLRPWVEELFICYHRSEHDLAMVQFRATLTSLLCHFYEECRESSVKHHRKLSRAQQETILRVIAEAGRIPVTPADLARELHYNPDYFSRLFRETYGIPARSWIVRQRMLKAATLLEETSQTISQIAESVGYTDIFLFSRQFKNIMGVSPTKYRKGKNL